MVTATILRSPPPATRISMGSSVASWSGRTLAPPSSTTVTWTGVVLPGRRPTGRSYPRPGRSMARTPLSTTARLKARPSERRRWHPSSPRAW